jgi:AsmA protein
MVVLVAPTSWARSHVISALETASGRTVRLENLSVCVGGGIELTNLEIGAPGAVSDPWLQAPRIQIDVSLLQLMVGRFEPTYLEVDGAKLRVLRREDGSLELADLVASRAGGDDAKEAEPHRCGPSKLKARLRNLHVDVVDQPSDTILHFDEIEGEGSWEGERAFVASLVGKLNEGSFEFTAHFDRSDAVPSFEGQFRATEVALDNDMAALRYLVPVLAGAPGGMSGRLTMDVYLRGRGESREELSHSLLGQGNVSVDPIELKGTPLIAEIQKVVDLPAREKAGSLRTDFRLQDGRVTTERLTLTMGRVPLVASGWTSFDGQLDYQVKLDGSSVRLPEKARRLMNDLDLDPNALSSFRLSGSVDRVIVKSNASDALGRSQIDRLIPREDQERLKTLGRRFRDKLMR